VLTLPARFLLFLSAFAPLFFIWTLRAWPGLIAWAFLLLVIVGLVGTALVVIVARRDEGQPVHLTQVEARQGDTAAYVVTYLIPFVTAPVVSIQDWVAIAVFLLLLTALYVTSDLISINPLLALAGFHLYRVEFDSRVVWLLSGKVKAGSDLAVAQLAESVYVEVTRS
jgi:hypothetical protein